MTKVHQISDEIMQRIRSLLQSNAENGKRTSGSHTLIYQAHEAVAILDLLPPGKAKNEWYIDHLNERKDAPPVTACPKCLGYGYLKVSDV